MRPFPPRISDQKIWTARCRRPGWRPDPKRQWILVDSMRDAGRPFAPAQAINSASTPSSRRPPEIVSVGALDLHSYDVARTQGPARRGVHGAGHLGRIAFGAAPRLPRAALVDDNLEPLADLGGELLRADCLRALHETLVAVRFNLVRNRLKAEVVGRRAFDGLVLERADAVELGLVQPVEQEAKILLGLAGKADDESRADRQPRAAPAA